LAVLITFLTCGVDNIGAQLEQPFDVLPLALLARTAHADVAETAAGWAGLLAGSGGWGGSNAGVPPWPVHGNETMGFFTHTRALKSLLLALGRRRLLCRRCWQGWRH
jgi:hypothetical protein